MSTAKLFESAGQLDIARVIRREGLGWVNQNQDRLRSIARSKKVQGIDGALQVDGLRLTNTTAPAVVSADVVIPFHSGDVKWLPECVESIISQNHASPVVHVISDGPEFPKLPDSVRKYRHDKRPGVGPYRLTNALVKGGHTRTDYLAIQDADDLSLPDRLRRQISLMTLSGAEMVSSAMREFGEHRNGHVLQPGVSQRTNPYGRHINSSRTVRLGLFWRVNGFADWQCAADFEFDNRVQLRRTGIVIHDHTVLGLRRVHSDSLSHLEGVRPLKSRKTKEIAELLRRIKLLRQGGIDPRSLGGLRDTSVRLIPA